MIPQRLDPKADRAAICELAIKWKIDPELAQKIHDLAASFPIQLYIISGYRTASEQDGLKKAGRPTADDDRSTHRTCPATGADISLSGFSSTNPPPAASLRLLGERARAVGLRWGGGSKLDAAGLPIDWGHVDLGPRV